jgi:hypothetical protein
MTGEEYQAILDGMTDDEFVEFRKKFGGDYDRKGYVDHYVRDGREFEDLLCGILKIPTEAQKQLAYLESGSRAGQEQSREAARANELSAEANLIARHSNRIAFWSCVLSVFSMIVAIVAVVVAAYRP